MSRATTIAVAMPRPLIEAVERIAKLAGVSPSTVIKVAMAAQVVKQPSAKVEGEKA